MKRLSQATAFVNLLLLWCTFTSPLAAEDIPPSPVKMEFVSEEEQVAPGHPFWVALHFSIADGWHLYGKEPGASGFPPKIAWHLPEGFELLQVEWPADEEMESEMGTIRVYEGEVTLLAEIAPPAQLEGASPIGVNIEWLACSDEDCFPDSATSTLTLPKGQPHQINPDAIALFAHARNALATTDSLLEPTLGWVLMLAFLGGLLLNLMPCVLPVISFKILNFVELAGQNRAKVAKHGMAFAGGVMVSFWLLASLLLALQSWGHAVGWGFQLQEPIFVAILAALIFIFALSLFGLFEFGALFAARVGSAAAVNKQQGHTASFLNGVLATAVATPCTGPFLGTAIGVAVTLPPIQALAIFSSLGFGMASPYLLLSFFPAFLRFLPRPGNWMVTFKEIMGFVMVATVLWLAWVFGSQTSEVALILLMGAFFFFAIGCWILGKWATPVKKRATRSLGVLLATLFFVGGSYTLYNASTSLPTPSYDELAMADLELPERGVRWERFSTKRLNELRKEGVPVFINFTARWCLTCQANHIAFADPAVSARFQELGVVLMEADWTRRDTEITEMLKKFGRNSVPLYLLYSREPDTAPEILPQLLTPDTLLQALAKI